MVSGLVIIVTNDSVMALEIVNFLPRIEWFVLSICADWALGLSHVILTKKLQTETVAIAMLYPITADPPPFAEISLLANHDRYIHDSTNQICDDPKPTKGN